MAGLFNQLGNQGSSGERKNKGLINSLLEEESKKNRKMVSGAFNNALEIDNQLKHEEKERKRQVVVDSFKNTINSKNQINISPSKTGGLSVAKPEGLWGQTKEAAKDTFDFLFEKLPKGSLNTYDKSIRPVFDEVGSTLLDNPVGKALASGNLFYEKAIEGMTNRAQKTEVQNPITAFTEGFNNPKKVKSGQVLFNENYTGGANIPGMVDLAGLSHMKSGMKTPGISELGGLGVDIALDPLNVPIFKGAKFLGGKANELTQNVALSRAINKAQPIGKNPLSEVVNRPAQVQQVNPIMEIIEQSKLKPNQGPLSQGKFKVSTPASNQLEDLYSIAKERGLPPGREYEYLQGLWSEIAPPTAGSLDDLIKAATKEGSVSDMVRTGAKNLQKAKEAQKYGIYQPLKLGEKEISKTVNVIDPFPTFKGNEAALDLSKLPKKDLTKSPFDVIPKGKPILNEQITPVKQIDEVAATVAETPKNSSQSILKNEKERGFIETLKESPKSSQPFLEGLEGKGKYKPITNAETAEQANRRVAHNIDEAAGYVLGAGKNNEHVTPEHIATGLRLIDEFQKQGNHQRAVDIAEKIAELGTKAGQSVQAFSIYNRLSPEGILLHAQRIASRVNERLRPGETPVKVTNEMASQLTDLATTVKAMEGANQSANNVISLMEKAKSGKKLTADELKEVQRFAQEAKKVIGDQAPKPKKAPSVPKEPAVRKQVISFLEQQEKAARERIAARKGRMNSLPVDELADYAIIGASKMGKGAVKFSIWSEQMVKEFGEDIRPHLAAIYDKAVETIENHVTAISRTRLSDVEKITNKALKANGIDPTEAENLRKMATEISKLTGEQKIEAMQELQATLQLLDKPTFLQKVSSFQTQAQLLNPKTLLTRNPLGNELFYRLERINKYLSTPIDWTRSKITGGERTVTFHTAGQGGYWKGFIKGAKAGWKGVNVNGLETQFDLRGPAFRGKWNPLTYTEKMLGASLRSFDNAAYERAVNQTIGEMATLRAINEGLTGQAKKEAIQRYMHQMNENGLAIAQEYGKYITFQDNNLLSMKLQNLKRGLNSLNKFVGVNDNSWGVGDILLKYPKTPGALVMRAIEYSPAGFLRGLYIASEPFFRKGVEKNTREATQAIARAITGSMGITGLGWFLADAGILTGSAEDDYEIQSLQRAIGEGDFKFNLSAMKRFVLSGFDREAAQTQKGDTLVTYDWAQPVAISASVGANISQNIQKNRDPLENAESVVTNSILGGFGTIAQQPVLEGITKPFRGYDLKESSMDTAKEIPASFVPTFLNQIRQAKDNTGRSTYDPKGWEEIKNKIKYKVPGLSHKLPRAFDTLGRPREVYQDGSNSLFNVFLNPAFVSKYNPTPEEQLIVDLYKRTGDKTIAPRIPLKSLRIDGETVKLTPEQYSQLQRIVGEETMKRLEKVNPNASDEAKIKKIGDILNEAGRRGREQIKKEYNIK
ncbi:hypothetical protein [Ammoniphilus resinae]|uniref:Large polyvalent protein associated domain-containing protein n=1 Tax=Ammoniphilus resinae TaxID=861532 RepID=A0ABS4GX68_9BACL|nr:hypothetical protein [Ammoniphilus resinae]MBP1934864.1 hypothetical protein [Ammoniphilus resinae]